MPSVVRLKKTLAKTKLKAGRGKAAANKSEHYDGATQGAKVLSKEGRRLGPRSSKDKPNTLGMPKRKLLEEKEKRIVKDEAKKVRNRSEHYEGAIQRPKVLSKEGKSLGPKSSKGKSNTLEMPKRRLMAEKGNKVVKDEVKKVRNRTKLPRKSGACDSGKNAVDDNDSEGTELPTRRPASTKGRGTREDYSSKDVDSKRKSNATRVKEKIESLEMGDCKNKSSTKTIGKNLSVEWSTRTSRIALEEKRTKRKRKGNELETLDRFSQKKTPSKSTVDAKTVVVDETPRKRKRIMRIDPHDVSNKRLVDSVAVKEEVVEKSHEISRNAQFRAIQPSPSILSFVEDNLLGRRRLNDLRRAGYNIKLSAPLDNIPFSTNAERERIEENVFRNKLTFFASAKVSSSFPPPEVSEIAFAGRSNVGKSSLLNALTRQWGVVRTSDKPGLTQTINFFKLASKLCLVDLPGYGFAYAKEEVKDAWEELVKEYVSTRIGLKRVCLLIDTQWGMKPRDHELIDLMERSQTKYQIVLTKTDMVFPINVARRAMQNEESLKTSRSMVKPVMMVSSKSGAGIRSLRTVLANVIRFAK